MVIQRAGADDAAEILSLQKLAYLSEAEIYGDYRIPPLLQTLGEIQRDFADQLFLKASVDGRIVGSVRARMERGTCLIGRLIVRPELQNRGIGTALMKGIEELFSSAERFELFTGHKSERNLHLYRKLGYRVFARERAGEKLTLVYMRKANNVSSGRGGATLR